MHYQNRTARLCEALTLVEMVIALAIMAVVFAAVLPQFRAIQNSWDSKAGAAEALQNGRVLMDHLYHNLSKAAQITAVSDSAETNGYIEFQDNAGATFRYDIGEDSYVEFGPMGSLSELAGPVSQLQFACFDACDLDTPITDGNGIRSVKFTTTLLNPSAQGRDRTFTGRAYLRANTISFGATVSPGVAVSDEIEVEVFGRIDGISGDAAVSTNSTGNNKVEVKDSGVIDGDVFVGPGGDPDDVIKLWGWGQITGSTGILSQVVDIPVPAAPSMGSSIGDRTYSSGTTTISSNLHCDKFTIRYSAKVQINGNVIILAEEEFTIEDWGQLRLMAEATLTLYTKDKFEAREFAEMNVNTADPSRLMINHLCGDPIELKDSSRLYATVVAPFAQLDIKDSARFYGSFKGEDVRIRNSGRLYAVPSGTMQQVLP